MMKGKTQIIAYNSQLWAILFLESRFISAALGIFEEKKVAAIFIIIFSMLKFSRN